MSTPTTTPYSADEIHRMLLRWQGEGLLDPAEVVRIEAAEAARHAGEPALPATTPPASPPGVAEPAGTSLIAEALGYAGGALIGASVAVLVGRSWSTLLFGSQVAVLAAAAVLLLAAGLFVPTRIGEAGVRLRAVLWLAATGLWFGLGSLVASKDGLDWQSREMLLFAAAVTVPLAAVLWWRTRTVLQHLAMFAALAVLAASLCDYLTFLDGQEPSLGVWLFAVGWVVLALLDVVKPPLVAYLVGSLVAVVAAETTAGEAWGAVFAVASASLVVAFAVWQHSIPLLAVGTYSVLTSVPAATDRLFPGSVGIVLGLMVAGAVLVLSALWITRRGARARPVEEAERTP